MPDVIVVTNQEDLEARRLVWKSLLCGTRVSNVCHTIDWVQLAFEHHYPQEWRVLFVHTGRKPVGILPLTITERRTPFGRFRVLGYPRPLHAPWYSPIGPNPAATLTAAMHYIHSEMDDWDVLDLEPVGKLGRDFQRTPTAMRLAGMDVRTRTAGHCGAIDVSVAAGEQGTSGTLQEAVQSSQRELESEFGSVQFQRFRPAGDLSQDVPEVPPGLIDLGLTTSRDDDRFDLSVREMAASQGMLDVTRLQAGERTLAATIAFYCGGQLMNLSCSVADGLDFTRMSQALMSRLVCDSAARGDEMIFLDDDRLKAWLNSTTSCEAYSFVKKSCIRARASCWLPEPWSVLSS